VQLGGERFATLNDVVRHYNSFFGLGLDDEQAHDLSRIAEVVVVGLVHAMMI
jgi:hypothetical protein